MTHLANVSCRLGKPLAWDNAAGRLGQDDANDLIKPSYSSPWKFPGY
jgi:hypothetical protein